MWAPILLLVSIANVKSQRFNYRDDELPDVVTLLSAEVKISDFDPYDPSERNVTFANGVTYSGQWNMEQPDGSGRLEVPPRDVYV